MWHGPLELFASLRDFWILEEPPEDATKAEPAAGDSPTRAKSLLLKLQRMKRVKPSQYQSALLKALVKAYDDLKDDTVRRQGWSDAEMAQKSGIWSGRGDERDVVRQSVQMLLEQGYISSVGKRPLPDRYGMVSGKPWVFRQDEDLYMPTPRGFEYYQRALVPWYVKLWRLATSSRLLGGLAIGIIASLIAGIILLLFWQGAK